MALWGISTTTETAANNYAIPKYVHTVMRANDRHNVFADNRGWVLRHYKSVENSGLSTAYWDEVLVPIVGLNTTGGTDVGTGLTGTGLFSPTPVAIFFEDPNRNSRISNAPGVGGTSGIGTGKTGYVHLVYNENVYCSAGATVRILQSTGAAIIGTASSTGAPVFVFKNDSGTTIEPAYNGQITNRIAFAFPVPGTGIGTVLSIDLSAGVVGVITDLTGRAATYTLTPDIAYNVGGAGTAFSVDHDLGLAIGIGTTTLTITA